MDAETIKDFLVSLGFAVDDAGAKKFDAVIAGVTANVFKMAVAVEGAALTVTAFTAKIASGLDNLYWASQRTGASVAGIKALGYAASQTGSDAASAQGSLESLSRFMRNNPGAESFLNRLGVQTRDAKGNLKDMASVFSGVGDKLKSMPYYRANQYAQMLGIDENTLMAMRRGMTGFTAEYSAMAKTIGYNADQAAVGSNRFMTSLRDFSAMAGMARDKIGSNLAEGLAGSIDGLRKQIITNFPKIEDAITRGVKGILWLADVIGRVVFRLIQAAGDIRQWFNNLDTGTQKLIATFGALLVAWRLLNSAFLMSPIGLITTLVGTLALFYEDYKTWKEGGNSLIDWSQWQPGIEKAIEAIKSVAGWINNAAKAIGGWENVLKGLAIYMGGKWLFAMLSPIGKVTKALLAFPAAFTAALNAAGLYVIIASINEAYQRIKAMANGTKYDQLVSQSEEMTELDRLKRNNWETNNPGIPYPEVKQPTASKEGTALLGWLQPTFSKLEALYKLPDGLLKSVAITESRGNPNAVSGAGAQGLFQIMPGTGKDLGLRGNDAFDPVKSAQAAAKYLSQLMKMNGGDLEKTLASYNWGVGNVQKHGMALMPQETRNYVPKVLSNMPGNTLNQETHITVYGSSDPRATAGEVEKRQSVVNSRATQQMNKGPN